MSEISPALRTLIERTGFTQDYLQRINTPYAAQLDHMDTFVAALHGVKSQEITISPDFDMDGITSGIILYAGLSQLGFHININIPDYTYGHDFSIEDVKDIVGSFPNTKVILTCDSGINSAEGIKYAQSLGMQVLVTDHHEQEIDCPAEAFINPCQFNSTFPLPGICGAAVAYLLVVAYARTYASPEECKFLDLLQLFAGIGTVSDVMPLIHDNRFLVRKSLQLSRELVHNPHALRALQSTPSVHPRFLTAFEGYNQLLQELRIAENNLGESFYGYTLAPMFNAPRRVGTPMQDAFDIFLSEDAEERRQAIVHLIAANTQRKQSVQDYLHTIDDTYAPYVYITDAPQGMLGLLAGHLMHESQLPTAVVHVTSESGDSIEGSMRSPDYYPIVDSLNNVHGLEVVGHQGAGGVKGPLQSLLDALQDVKIPDDWEKEPALIIGTENNDVAWYNENALKEIADFLDSIGPFGKNFEYPVIELHVPYTAQVDYIGKEKQHMKISAPGCPPVLVWNTHELPANGIQIRFNYNVFRGFTTLQMIAQN
ncbi:DHH family phosphoesterase [Alloscardovia criceti]|uniref:DHH family phosphoesterase n=1 Tax=Alloscardovia criceti TaxID=356828 RepID=UPI000365496F|nr:DHH family phosphoesterase [Alloscardovia criceti]